MAMLWFVLVYSLRREGNITLQYKEIYCEDTSYVILLKVLV